MDWVRDVLRWFSGGDNQYHNLIHCMSHDTLWIVITVTLDIAVAVGYGLIALHWWQNQRNLQNESARKALGHMRNIFIFCGLCGYLFVPLKLFWPAWRLYDMFLVVLVYLTWRYAWNARDLKVIYKELGKTTALESQLTIARAESSRKTHFLNAVSHDLKNPVYGISLHAEAASRSLARGNTDAARDAIRNLESVTSDLSRLLQNLLEIGKLDWSDEPLNIAEFDVRDLTAQVVKLLHPVAVEKGLTLTLQTAGEAMVQSDRSKVERVIINLVNNAIQFTEQGSVALRVENDGQNLHIEVSDTGMGIAEEDRASIFDEFFQMQNRARNPQRGFGLGLAITRKLVDKLRGRISVESEVGHGSTFKVVLPSRMVDDVVQPVAIAPAT